MCKGFPVHVPVSTSVASGSFVGEGRAGFGDPVLPWVRQIGNPAVWAGRLANTGTPMASQSPPSICVLSQNNSQEVKSIVLKGWTAAGAVVVTGLFYTPIVGVLCDCMWLRTHTAIRSSQV